MSSQAQKNPLQVYGLRLSAGSSVLLGSAALWALWSAIAVWWFSAAWTIALLVGPLAVALHWLSDLVHQIGHAWAARRVGHPAVALHFWGVFSTIIYPKDEPELTGSIHIQRALGGPLFSLGMSAIGALWLWLTPDSAPAWRWLVWFFFLDNFVLLTLQVFLPLGFNDGATIFYWMRTHDR
jgi:hypothetical protein